jgi:uncharacterized protein YjbI with pentapeptide repeats
MSSEVARRRLLGERAVQVLNSPWPRWLGAWRSRRVRARLGGSKKGVREVDLRGCVVPADEWRVLRSTREGPASVPGTWLCDDACFASACEFTDMTFAPGSHFRRSQFGVSTLSGLAHTNFSNSAFLGRVEFDGAAFAGSADFFDARFEDDVRFHGVVFGEGANFVRTRFVKSVLFSECTFGPHAEFEGCRFLGGVAFVECKFMDVRLKLVEASGFLASMCSFGDSCSFDVKSATDFILGECDLGAGTDVGASAEAKISVDRNRFGPRARLKLSSPGGGIDLKNTILGSAPRIVAQTPAEIYASGMEFSDGGAVSVSGRICLDRLVLGNTLLVSSASLGAGNRVASQAVVSTVASTDLADVVLSNVDLSQCRFVPAYNADKVRLDGSETFAFAPEQWWRSKRRVLADEIAWRHQHSSRQPLWSALAVAGSADSLSHRSDARRVAQAYRALRKSKEDSKDEPGAADFYYGEMEMRRAGSESFVERLLLAVYWAISGYGLRAWRAFTAFVAVLLLASLAMYLWGFDTSPQTVQAVVHFDPTSGAVTYGRVSLGADHPGFGDALLDCTRLATALLQPIATLRLTTAGRFVEIALRFIGPLLLGLLVLSVRGRTKR